jgi:hypothetical protein
MNGNEDAVLRGRTLFHFCGSVVLGLAFLSQAFGQAPPSGLVAFYPFNGNANDQNGSGINGIVSNALPIADRFGHPNAAYFFNGTNSQITFASPPWTQPSWSLSAWVNPASMSQLSSVLLLGYDNDVPNGMSGFSLGMAGSVESPGAGLFLILGDTTWEWINSGFSFTAPNQWYHVVAAYDGNARFYVNGAPTTANGISTTSPRAPIAFTIGSSRGFRFFNGLIDDVRIYDHALQSAEVQQLYQYESQPCVTRGALATAVVTNGFVIQINVTEEGCGYTNEPTVTIVGGGGTNATAIAHISNGMVTSISVTGAGIGYTSTPTVWVGSPPLLPSVLSVSVSAVKVAMQVWPGNSYVLESSNDLKNWTPTGPAFMAQTNLLVQEFPVSETGRFFRIEQVP